MTPEEAITLFIEDCRARHLSEHTLTLNKLQLQRFSDWCTNRLDDLRDATPQTITDFAACIRKRKRPDGQLISRKYQNRHIRLVRQLFKLLAKRNLILTDITANLQPLTDPKDLPKGIMNKHQVMKLLSQPYVTTPLGFRDRTMMEVLYSTALRGGELCRLTLYDLDLPDRTLRVLQGKGNKDRVVPVGKVACSYLAAYIKTVRPILLGKHVSSLIFLTANGGTLHSFDLGRIIKTYREKAHLPDNITTHSFRHTCATEMLKGGASIRHLQELLGHADIMTTQIYTHVVQSDLKKAHARTAPSERRKPIDVPTFDPSTPSWNDNRNAKYWPVIHSSKNKTAPKQQKTVKRKGKSAKKKT